MSGDRLESQGLLAAFERLAGGEPGQVADPLAVLEGAALAVALAVLGLLDEARGARAFGSRVRKTLLGAGALRIGATDEDARDALDLAIAQARMGSALLGGAPLSTLDGVGAGEPTPREVARLLRGELDGFAAADVALRLHRSGARAHYAAFLPAHAAPPRVRLAADSAPSVRDPALGRSLGTTTLGKVTLEAYVFPDGILAIYAEPAVGLSVASIDVALTARPAQTAGYLELRVEGDPERVALVLADGALETAWTLGLR